MPAPPSSAQTAAKNAAVAKTAAAKASARAPTSNAGQPRNQSTGQPPGAQSNSGTSTAFGGSRVDARAMQIRDAAIKASQNIPARLNNRNPLPGNSNPALQYGPGTSALGRIATPTPVPKVDAALPGMAQRAQMNELTQSGVLGGQGVVAFEAGQLTTALNPFDRVFGEDSQIKGRLAQATRPGAGVPDLPIHGQTVYKTSMPPALAAKPAPAVPSNDFDLAYKDVTGIPVPQQKPSLYDETGQPIKQRTTEPNGYTPPAVPTPRMKPDVDIGAALRALAPTASVKQFQERARPEMPAENVAIPGQIGTVLSQDVAAKALPGNADNLFKNLTGAPPTRVALNPANFKVSAPEAVAETARPPGNFAAPKPEVQGQLHEIINRMVQAKQIGTETEVGTPEPVGAPPPATVPIPRQKPQTSVVPTTEQVFAARSLNQAVLAGEPTALEKAKAIGKTAATVASIIANPIVGITSLAGRKLYESFKTQQERDAYLQEHYPATWAAEQERRATKGSNTSGRPGANSGGNDRPKASGGSQTGGGAPTSPVTPNPNVAAGPNMNLLAQYLAEQLRIRSEAGNGIISI